MTTLQTITDRCGVSPATVSKALNGAWDISETTARWIRCIADKMGYVPNSAARTLWT